MLKIYGANLSAPANKVRMVANFLEIEYDYIQVKIREGEHRKPEFLKMHPAGKIPVINQDGFTLFESDAILKYLAAEKKSFLYPEDIKQRACIDQWMDFTSVHVGGAMGRVLFNRVFTSLAKVPVDENSLKDGVKFLNRFLPVIDQQLAIDGNLAGEQFSLADISLLATLDPAEVSGIKLDAYRHIVVWRNELRKKKFYTKCHASYEEALKNMMAEVE